MSSAQPIAFLGATGGCTFAALTRTLEAGIPCRTLVRTPQKLWDMINNSRSPIDKTKVASLLTIVQGDAKNLESVKELLSVKPKLIVFGVGGTPTIQMSITSPVSLTDPHICSEAMTTLLDALTTLQLSPPPAIIAISTTGLSSSSKDVPFGFRSMYKYALHVPHVDKHEMEDILTSWASQLGLNWVLVRPSLLTDSSPKSADSKCPTQRTKAIRVGWENGPNGPAVGYTISRDDVGRWIFENLLQPVAKQDTLDGTKAVESEWFGRKVSITH
ncbi:hypothetical protein ACM66B_007096 [Microbotryomycetes sp. NB124-2]